ncbi:hypothetical protein [uncultured Corynebacterium sp.]|uniref:hypothetical protein n=1 Tax=uncultured Corynebacterium sp. TaxID=159447 RepID=UPI0025CD5721|nr:hypothetical protein [uncultured Corynebacterium sp.]
MNDPRGRDVDPTSEWEPIDGGLAWSETPEANGDEWGAPPPRDGAGDRNGGYGAQPGPATGGYSGPPPGAHPGAGPGSYPGAQPGPYSGPNSGPGPGQYQGPPPGAYPAGGWQGEPPRGGGGGVKVLLSVLIALLLLVGAGLLGYYLLSDDDGDTAGAGGQSTATQGDDAASEGEDAAGGRAEGFAAPADWTQCGGSGAPGDLNLYYAGTSVTSCPFTKSVRDAFVEHYADTGELSGTIQAYSSVTGTSYSMNCTDDGDVVTCRGGNNAVVHIV